MSSGAWITINGGSKFTNHSKVQLVLETPFNYDRVQFSTKSDCSDGEWTDTI